MLLLIVWEKTKKDPHIGNAGLHNSLNLILLNSQFYCSATSESH